MRLTRKKAIQITKELWEWLAETGGGRKGDWPGWDKYGVMAVDCPLCEYNSRHTFTDTELSCEPCPYFQALGHCNMNRTPFRRWIMAVTKENRQKYANLFLEQLKQL